VSLTRLALLLALAGCAPQPPPQSPPPTEAPERAIAPETSAKLPAPDAGSAPAEPGDPPSVAPLAFQQVLGEKTHSIGFGKKSVATLGAEVFVDRGQGFAKLGPISKPTAELEIYFGRDEQPRIMGWETTDAGRRAVYLRFRGGAWQNGASEIGKLGGPSPGALFGVLGYADPEVVCKESEGCIIKRLTGWTTIAAPERVAEVLLCNGQAWAHAAERVWKLGAKAFEPFGTAPTFSSADALWAHSERDVWIAEHGSSSLHQFDGERWTKSPSPIAGPRSLWASGPAELWLAGDGGLARHDGKLWARVEGAPKQATLITGRGDGAIWIAASTGVHRATPKP
jgi:hypothetical protein